MENQFNQISLICFQVVLNLFTITNISIMNNSIHMLFAHVIISVGRIFRNKMRG